MILRWLALDNGFTWLRPQSRAKLFRAKVDAMRWLCEQLRDHEQHLQPVWRTVSRRETRRNVDEREMSKSSDFERERERAPSEMSKTHTHKHKTQNVVLSARDTQPTHLSSESAAANNNSVANKRQSSATKSKRAALGGRPSPKRL